MSTYVEKHISDITYENLGEPHTSLLASSADAHKNSNFFHANLMRNL